MPGLVATLSAETHDSAEMKKLFAGVASELAERVLSPAVADRVAAERSFATQIEVLDALADVFSGDEEAETRLVRLAEGVAGARATQLAENLETGKLSPTEAAGEIVRSFTELSAELPKKLAACGATLRTAVQRQFRLRCVTSDGVLDALYTAFFELQEADLQLTLSRTQRSGLEPRLREVLAAMGLTGDTNTTQLHKTAKNAKKHAHSLDDDQNSQNSPEKTENTLLELLALAPSPEELLERLARSCAVQRVIYGRNHWLWARATNPGGSRPAERRLKEWLNFAQVDDELKTRLDELERFADAGPVLEPRWALEDAFGLRDVQSPEVVALLGRPGRVCEAGVRRVEARVGEKLLVGFVPAECADVTGYLEEKVAEIAKTSELPAFILVGAPGVDRHVPGERGVSRVSGSDAGKSAESRQKT